MKEGQLGLGRDHESSACIRFLSSGPAPTVPCHQQLVGGQEGFFRNAFKCGSLEYITFQLQILVPSY